MQFFLDENFPLQLHYSLEESGYKSEHVITEKLRGIEDSELAEYLAHDQYIFLTNDNDFLDLLSNKEVILFISHVPQQLKIETRIQRWLNAIRDYFQKYKDSKYWFFVISPSGTIKPWKVTRMDES